MMPAPERKAMPQTRIFYATDIHGSEICFTKFLRAGEFYKAQVLIVGGDITGKMVIPVIEQHDGGYSIDFMGTTRVANGDAELLSLEKSITDAGFYPYRTTFSGYQELKADQAKVDSLFSRLMVESVRRWLAMAEESLSRTDVKCFITPGNDDRLDIDSLFENGERVINPEGKLVKLDEHHEMISTGYANMTPWNCPRDISEEELAKRLDSMAAQVEDMSNCVFNFHCPPFDSGLDSAPKLDEELRVSVKDGGLSMVPVGSVSVRSAIVKYQPLLGLHGHIHESRGTYKIGRTLCVNPGSEYSEGILRGMILNIEKDRVKGYLPTSG